MRSTFQKLGNSRLKSWHLELYNGFDIRPAAADQGPYPTCVFHSHAKGGQMSVHRAHADVDMSCDIVMTAASMIKDVLVLNKMSSQDLWLKNPMADVFFHRIDIASWILTRLGVEATSDCFYDPRRVAVNDVRRLGFEVKFQDLADLLDKGKPVLTIMIAGPDFHKLKDDEIYSCSTKPRFENNKLQEPHQYHMVILIGHGEAEFTGRKIVAFLNSHSEAFAKDGCGWLYFAEVRWFYCIESEHPPITKPHLRPKQAAEMADRLRHIDAPRWKTAGRYVIPKKYEKKSEASTSTWRSQEHGEPTKPKLGSLLGNDIHTASSALLGPEANKYQVKLGMTMAMHHVDQNLRSMVQMPCTSESIAQVAMYAADREYEIGNLISAAFSEVGKNGIIAVMDGSTCFSELEVVPGLKLNRGFTSPYFITNQQTKQCELKNPLVLLCTQYLSKLHVDKLWRITSENKRNLLIITDEIEADASTTLLHNKLYSTFKVCVVKVPGSGQKKQLNMETIAEFTGAEILTDMNDEKLPNLQMLGSCELVMISRNECILISGTGDVEMRTVQLVQALKETSLYCKEAIHERVSNLVCSAAVLKIGATSKEEVGLKKNRVTDALKKAKAALKAGIVAGGGYALLYATKHLDKLETQNNDQKMGIEIIQNALRLPVYMALSKGPDATFKVDMLLKQDSVYLGYDATGLLVDLLDTGTIEAYEEIRTDLMAAEVEASAMLVS